MINGPQREVMRISPQEEEILRRTRAYRADLPRYAADNLRVIDRQSASLIPFRMNATQMILHAKAQAQIERIGMVRALVLKGRKMGCSTFVGARFYTRARLWNHQRVKVMAHDQRSTNTLFDMVRTFYQHDPWRLRAENDSAAHLRFSNGSSYGVITAGGSGESGRGDTPTLGHMSEVAFYKNAEKNFASFANSIPVAPQTEIWAESTANGMGNEFHRRWSLAEGGVEDGNDPFSYVAIFVPWFLDEGYHLPVPDGFELIGEPEGEGLPSERDIAEMYGLSNGQMAWRRMQIGSQFGGSVSTFMQEYPCTTQEAFQKTDLDLFIKPLAVAKARKRKDIPPMGPRVMGVDPAGLGGDRFAIALRQGSVLLWIRTRKGVQPGEEQVEWVTSLMREWSVDRCNVDYSGGWGSALMAGMRERYPDLAAKTAGVDFGATSQFKMVKPHAPGPRNRRAEMYTRMRDWFDDPAGVQIPDDDELQGDLGAVTARISGQSTDTVLTSKKEIRAVLGRSPDVADAVALTFAIPDRAVATVEGVMRPRPIPHERDVGVVATGGFEYTDAAPYGSWMV